MKPFTSATVLQLFALTPSLGYCAHAQSVEARQSKLTPPTEDSFYQPVGAWQTSQPGDILAHRTPPNPLKGVNYTAAYQLLYRTTDSLGNATATVTTVIIPENADFTKLLSYQTFEDSADPNCAPSFTLQQGGLFQLDTGFEQGLEQGWIISTPDYEGPNGAFTAGVISGQATLDSIRAVLKSGDITKVDPKATVAMFGYSGGALASEWASELQGTYAPELNISGTAIGGLTPNVSSVAVSINNQTDSGLFPSGVLGLVSAYPNLTSYLNESFVSDEKREDFWKSKGYCLAESGVSEGNIDFFSYFKQGVGFLSDPKTLAVVQAGGLMGVHGTPLTSNALLVFKSTKDEVSRVEDTDKLVDQYCKAGSRIRYIRDDFGSHLKEGSTRADTAIDYLQGIFNGTNMQPSGCTIETFNEAGDVISSTSIAATTSVTPTPSMSGDPTSSPTTTSSEMGTSPSSSGPPPASTTGAAYNLVVSWKIITIPLGLIIVL